MEIQEGHTCPYVRATWMRLERPPLSTSFITGPLQATALTHAWLKIFSRSKCDRMPKSLQLRPLRAISRLCGIHESYALFRSSGLEACSTHNRSDCTEAHRLHSRYVRARRFCLVDVLLEMLAKHTVSNFKIRRGLGLSRAVAASSSAHIPL